MFLAESFTAAASDGSWLMEYLSLLRDPAHILFEITTDIALAGVVAAPIRKWWQRHHEQEH